MTRQVRQRRKARTAKRTSASVRLVAGSLVLCAVFGASALGGGAEAFAQTPAAAQEGSATKTDTARVKEINPVPFRVLLAKARELYRAGEINLSDRVEMTVEADRNDDGSLSNISVSTLATNNPRLDELARDFVLALNDTRALSVFEGARHMSLSVNLGEKSFAVRTIAEMDTEARAASMSKGFGAILGFWRHRTRGTNNAVVYNNMTTSANGKQLAITLEMPRQSLGNLLLKQVTPN